MTVNITKRAENQVKQSNIVEGFVNAREAGENVSFLCLKLFKMVKNTWEFSTKKMHLTKN